MAWTREELAKIEKAYQSGVIEVEYAGQKIKYRSLSEMEILIESAKQQLSGADDDGGQWQRKKINPVYRR